MVRSGDPEATSEIWGTLEELLLACAVSRHGTWSWDSVAMEVRSRSPSARHLLLTPEGCKERYRDLERRFSASDGKIGGGGGGPGLEIPWLEELRKLRVAELRREVQRYDGSILSLQLKVKKLQEEREQSLLEGDDGKRRPDLKEKEGKKNGESPGSTPGNNPGNRISGDSGRSCEESNSTDPKDDEEKPRVGLEKAEAAPDAENKSPDRVTGGDVKSAGEASYNGSSDTIAKAAAVANTARLLPLGDSAESMAESKGGGPEAEREGARETSDVQSSASLSRRRRRRGGRRKVFSGCSSGGDEPEADAVSAGGKRVAAESQPLITFVELIRAHKFGSVFERRLESQDSVRYRSMIRRHVDLEMVRAKLEGRGGRKAYTSAEVFRDLLLLCYNAIVFYAKSSPESTAAVHLRGLVTKEMARIIRKPARPPKAEEPAPPAQRFPPPPVSKLKSDPDRASEPLEKQTSLVPLTACRKRSSLSGKASAAAGWKEGKEENEKHRVDRKEREVEEDETPTKKRTNEGSLVSRPRGLRSNKTAGNAGNRGNGVSKSPNSISSPIIKSTAVETSTTEATAKSVKKNGGGEAVSASKKKGAAEFLIRMKRSSPTSNGKLRNTLRRSASSGGGGGGKGGEQQKKGGRGDGRKDRDSRRSPGAAASKRAAENSGPVKRSVGRPPKRAAAPPPPPPAKRAKDELGRRPSSRNRARR